MLPSESARPRSGVVPVPKVSFASPETTARWSTGFLNEKPACRWLRRLGGVNYSPYRGQLLMPASEGVKEVPSICSHTVGKDYACRRSLKHDFFAIA